jgi:hypothetical protein
MMIPIKSKTATLTIRNIDDNVFTAHYHSCCLECDCKDLCCGYGCPMDIVEVERIMAFRKELEKSLGRDASQWFMEQTEANTDYPSGDVKRTMIYDGYCVFHDRFSRGCSLQRLALEKGIDPHQLKPMVCFFFPLTWDGDYLHVATFLDELPCQSQGGLILDLVGDDIKYYLGEEFATEIDSLKNQYVTRRIRSF